MVGFQSLLKKSKTSAYFNTTVNKACMCTKNVYMYINLNKCPFIVFTEYMSLKIQSNIHCRDK